MKKTRTEGYICKHCGELFKEWPSLSGHVTANHSVKYGEMKFEDIRKNDTRRKWLIEERGHKCEVCGLAEWMDKPIPLELDHISGIHDDHRKENLRLICPNCHAQTDTYKGKNMGRNKDTKRQEFYKKYPIQNYR